jgi:hypothetical protein
MAPTSFANHDLHTAGRGVADNPADLPGAHQLGDVGDVDLAALGSRE